MNIKKDDKIKQLADRGVYMNIVSYGAELAQVKQHDDFYQALTVQNGTPMFTGTVAECYIYLTGYLHGIEQATA